MGFRVCVFCAAVAATAGSVGATVVADWNVTLLNAVKATSANPPRASRAMAMVHGAVYDAVNGINGPYQPYRVLTPASGNANRTASAAAAAHRVLSSLFPTQQAAFDAQLAASLAQVPDGKAKQNGIAYGQFVADEMLAWRATDHANDPPPPWPDGVNPGEWRRTPPAFADPLLPHWGSVTPFAMTSGDQFRPPAPPDVDSPEYTAAYNEVKEIGRVDSATRTPEQTDIAKMWAAGAGTVTPPGMWNQVAQQLSADTGLGILGEARLFGLIGLAVADAAISCWDAKYAYNYWRPVTGIRLGDADGNPDTAGDAGWLPLIATPPFPSYTSGHSTFSAASAKILEQFFGTDDLSFSVTAPEVGITRFFNSCSEAAEEAGQSRIYGGIHWQFDNGPAQIAGQGIGVHVYQNYMQVPGPGAASLAVAVGFMAARRNRRLG